MTDIKKELNELKERITILESKLKESYNELPKTEGEYQVITFGGGVNFLRELSSYDINNIEQGIAYKNEEDCDKVKRANRTHCKIARIARRLNAGRIVDWDDEEQAKYSLVYLPNSTSKIRYDLQYSSFSAGDVVCLEGELFQKTVLKEIPIDDLINYFTNFGKVQLWDYDYED